MKSEKKFSLKKKYLVFFLLIGLIPFIVFTFIYCFTALVDMKEGLEKDFASTSSQLLSGFEYRIQKIDVIASDFSNYLYGDSSFQDLDNIETKEALLSNLLQRYKSVLGNGFDIFFYEKGTAHIYTDAGLLSYQDFENTYLSNIDITGFPFFSYINQQSVSRIKTSGKYTFFFESIPKFDFIPWSNLIVMANNEEIKETLFGSVPDKNFSYLLIADSGQKIFGTDNYDDLDIVGKADIQNFLEGDSSRYSLSMNSLVSNVRLLCSIDKGILYMSYYHQIFWYVVFSILLLLVIVLLAIYLAKFSYSPINNLAKAILGQETTLEGNEVKLISNEWDSVMTLTGELQTRVQRQNDILIIILVKNLITGRFTGTLEEKSYFLSQVKTVLVHQYFQVAILDSGFNEDSVELFEKVLRTHDDSNILFFPVHLENNDSLILVINSRTEDAEANLKELEALLSLIQNDGYHLASGRSTSRLESLNLSYIEALLAFSDNNAEKSIVFDDNDMKIDGYVIPRSYYNLYTQSVLTGDVNAALSVLDRLFSKLTDGNFVNPINRGYLYDILNLVIRVAESSNLDASVYSSIICDVNNVEKFKAQIIKATENITLAKNEEMTELHKKEKADIIEFVDKHFRDSQMSLSYLSDKFSKSISYLSRFFKSEINTSFVDYLSNLRLDWIKLQLSGTDKPLRDIIAESGYNDISGVMRRFKAREGLTMGQYREKKETSTDRSSTI